MPNTEPTAEQQAALAAIRGLLTMARSVYASNPDVPVPAGKVVDMIDAIMFSLDLSIAQAHALDAIMAICQQVDAETSKIEADPNEWMMRRIQEG